MRCDQATEWWADLRPAPTDYLRLKITIDRSGPGITLMI